MPPPAPPHLNTPSSISIELIYPSKKTEKKNPTRKKFSYFAGKKGFFSFRRFFNQRNSVPRNTQNYKPIKRMMMKETRSSQQTTNAASNPTQASKPSSMVAKSPPGDDVVADASLEMSIGIRGEETESEFQTRSGFLAHEILMTQHASLGSSVLSQPTYRPSP